MPPLRNQRQERFCLEYHKDQNGTRSARAAGYTCSNDNSARATAAQVLRSINVRARIMELGAEERRQALAVAERNMIDQAWVVNKLVSNVDRAMQAEAVLDKYGRPTGVYTYEGNVANKGLELIGKNLGMFQDKAPLQGLLEGAQVQVNVYLPGKARDSVPMNGEPHAHRNGDTPPTDD